MINKIIVLGRLGRDVERKEYKTGNTYCRFTIATNEWVSSKNEEETTWHNVTCFNDYAGKQLDDRGKKGTLVYLEGKQNYSTYTNKEGQEVTQGSIVLDRLGSVCKIVEKNTDGYKPSVKKDDDEFGDEVPF